MPSKANAMVEQIEAIPVHGERVKTVAVPQPLGALQDYSSDSRPVPLDRRTINSVRTSTSRTD